MSDEKEGKIHIAGNPEKGSWVKDAFCGSRESGWYFVKTLGTDYFQPAEWVCKWNSWRILGFDGLYHDDHFDEIDERRIVRENTVDWKIAGETERIPQNE